MTLKPEELAVAIDADVSPAGTKAAVTQEEMLAQLSKETGTDVQIGDLQKIMRARYELAMMQFRQSGAQLTVRGLMRAVTNAIDFPIESGTALKFNNKDEVQMAGLLAQIIDMRNVLQAEKINQGEK